MRIAALAILTVLAVLAVLAVVAAAPAEAQTYNPRYPVCLQTYTIGGGIIDCRYFSLEQCNVSAEGRGGSCFNNPYFAGAPSAGGSPYRR